MYISSVSTLGLNIPDNQNVLSKFDGSLNRHNDKTRFEAFWVHANTLYTVFILLYVQVIIVAEKAPFMLRVFF